eukprot:TRINITY_DN5042_c0_g2_i2.p1 TRINITY_DN5042_c0_g2~~TRINITY_DN5042_c0_g2_i2.p1  ORF type:complete len:120 (-),score=23.66 TRINITY_DN5042_c0_g2_i2:5-313(-)
MYTDVYLTDSYYPPKKDRLFSSLEGAEGEIAGGVGGFDVQDDVPSPKKKVPIEESPPVAASEDDLELATQMALLGLPANFGQSSAVERTPGADRCPHPIRRR